MDTKNLLSLDEAAELLNVSVRRARQLCTDGVLGAWLVPPGAPRPRWVVPRRGIAQYITRERAAGAKPKHRPGPRTRIGQSTANP